MDVQVSSYSKRLPFSFANRFKLVLEPSEAGMALYYVEPISVQALLEVKRVYAQTFSLQPIDIEAFERNLTEAYQRDS